MTLTLLMAVSCTEKQELELPTSEKPEEIGGTDLKESANLYGRFVDTSGKPIAGVAVSDGRTVVTTDANGVYQMTRSRLSRFVFYTTPAGYEINVDSNGHPLFYEVLDQTKDYLQYDFTLKPLSSGAETNFALLCVADPQCRSTNEIDRFRNETIPDMNRTIANLKSEGIPAYAVTLGDIIFDTPELWTNIKTAMTEVNVPIFQTIGNHDHLANSANETTAEANFESHFGPRNYSFDRGNVHVVVMDNIIYTGGRGGSNYNGGISDNQLAWLTADLALVPKTKTVVFCAHIPFRSLSSTTDESKKNGSAVLDLLGQFDEAHLMIGHTHYNENYIHTRNGKRIIEHVHGAACGAWWAADICADGTPNGYGVYKFGSSGVSDYYYKATGEKYDRNFQMRAYPGAAVFGSTSNGSTSFGWRYTSSTYNDARCVVVNVWNAIDADRSPALAWDVELWQNDKKVCNMTRVSTPEWWAFGNFVLKYQMSAGSSTYKNNRRHIFYGMLNSGSDAVNQTDSQLNFEIKVTDHLGNVYTCNTLQRTL